MKIHELIEKTLSPPDIETGDTILVGKWKNSKRTVKGFKKDKHGQPVLKTNKGDKNLFNLRLSKLEEGREPNIRDYFGPKPANRYSDKERSQLKKVFAKPGRLAKFTPIVQLKPEHAKIVIRWILAEVDMYDADARKYELEEAVDILIDYFVDIGNIGMHYGGDDEAYEELRYNQIDQLYSVLWAEVEYLGRGIYDS